MTCEVRVLRRPESRDFILVGFAREDGYDMIVGLLRSTLLADCMSYKLDELH